MLLFFLTASQKLDDIPDTAGGSAAAQASSPVPDMNVTDSRKRKRPDDSDSSSQSSQSSYVFRPTNTTPRAQSGLQRAEGQQPDNASQQPADPSPE